MLPEVQVNQVTTDLSDDTALNALFRPPMQIVHDVAWVERYNALVRRLQRDSAGLPLDMAQRMLIERIASTYILILWHQAAGDVSASQMDNMNKLYLSYVTQFQKVLQASDEVLRQDLIKKFGAITTGMVDLIQDEATRKVVRNYLRTQFAAIGF